jgi:hypothetical protein
VSESIDRLTAAFLGVHRAVEKLSPDERRRVFAAIQVLLPEAYNLANPNAQGWMPNQRAQVAGFYEKQQEAIARGLMSPFAALADEQKARARASSDFQLDCNRLNAEHQKKQQADFYAQQQRAALSKRNDERLECAEPECPACPESFGGQEHQ